jgi:hypothetical protein
VVKKVYKSVVYVHCTVDGKSAKWFWNIFSFSLASLVSASIVDPDPYGT